MKENASLFFTMISLREKCLGYFFSVERRYKTHFESKRRLYPVPRSSKGVFAKLNEFVAEMRQYSRVESTQRKYINEFHCFEVWCDKARLSALPASPDEQGRSVSRADFERDSGYCKFHVIRGLSNLCDDQAWRSSSKP